MEKTKYRKKTVALYNEIFEKGLSSSELQVYFALLLFENSKTHYCHVKHRTLAAEIGTNEVNVSCALNKLRSKGLISIKKRYKPYTGDQVSNGYYVKQMTGRFCVIKSSVLRLMLPKSVFKVYLYFYCHAVTQKPQKPFLACPKWFLCYICPSVPLSTPSNTLLMLSYLQKKTIKERLIIASVITDIVFLQDRCVFF